MGNKRSVEDGEVGRGGVPGSDEAGAVVFELHAGTDLTTGIEALLRRSSRCSSWSTTNRAGSAASCARAAGQRTTRKASICATDSFYVIAFLSAALNVLAVERLVVVARVNLAPHPFPIAVPFLLVLLLEAHNDDGDCLRGDLHRVPHLDSEPAGGSPCQRSRGSA